MKDPYGPKRRSTDKIRRVSTHPDAITQVQCPICCGCGLVSPDVAVMCETLITKGKDKA